MRDPRELRVPELALAAFGVVVLAAILFGMATSATAFGAFNYGWDGTADLRGVAAETGNSAVMGNTTVYERLDGNGTLVVMLGPNEPYEPEETARIRSFVRRGGTLLVAGDFGPVASEVLAGIDASVRIDGTPLRDERRHGPSPAMPIATINGLEGIDELALNYPTALTGVAGANVTVMANTSAYAYADENGNDELDESESMRAYPIVARETLGAGSVVVLSDPSAFINSMLDRGDNRAFARALFSSVDRVRFDYTHAGGVPPLVRALGMIRTNPATQFLFGALLVGGLVVVSTYGRAIRERLQPAGPEADGFTVTEDEIVTLLARNHPEWDRDRVRRLAAHVASRRRGMDEESR